MSPRRKVEADELDFFEFTAAPARRWGLTIISIAVSVLIAAALTVGTLMLISHERDHRTAVNDADALGYVRQFMTGYTTLDPFNANAICRTESCRRAPATSPRRSRRRRTRS